MAPYIHHHIPEIEKYANQLEWLENILEDRDSTEVTTENTLIDLEKQLNEDSFLQVPGESQAQEESKEPNLSEEPNQTGRLELTMSTPLVLQTPLNEEKSLKRNREGATTSRRATSQAYVETSQAKRQRVNIVSEQEYTEETVEITST